MTPADVSVELLDRPVDPGDLAPVPDGAGGETVFLGRTRPETHPEHGPLLALDYDCHRPLARRVLETIACEAAERHGCRRLRILHAVGPVPIGAASVLVQAAAPHRAEAFAACREGIDRLKREAPIWKRERWADGTSWAEGVPVTPAGAAAAAGGGAGAADPAGGGDEAGGRARAGGGDEAGGRARAGGDGEEHGEHQEHGTRAEHGEAPR